jgi:hypothetical protein
VEGVEWFRGKGNRGIRQVQRGCCPRYQKGSEWGSAVPKKIQKADGPLDQKDSERRGSAESYRFREERFRWTKHIQRGGGPWYQKYSEEMG